MLPADLSARLTAAGLPTDLEGMLEAAREEMLCRSEHGSIHWFSLMAERFPGLRWIAMDEPQEAPPRAYRGWTAAEAVARWLLAAKEAHRT